MESEMSIQLGLRHSAPSKIRQFLFLTLLVISHIEISLHHSKPLGKAMGCLGTSSHRLETSWSHLFSPSLSSFYLGSELNGLRFPNCASQNLCSPQMAADRQMVIKCLYCICRVGWKKWMFWFWEMLLNLLSISARLGEVWIRSLGSRPSSSIAALRSWDARDASILASRLVVVLVVYFTSSSWVWVSRVFCGPASIFSKTFYFSYLKIFYLFCSRFLIPERLAIVRTERTWLGVSQSQEKWSTRWYA